MRWPSTRGWRHPETLIDDRPMTFGAYAPQNFDRLYRGTIRMREALQLSLNIPVVALTEALGPAKLLARRWSRPGCSRCSRATSRGWRLRWAASG